MAAETQYKANTGMVQITTANTSLTGSGTVGTDIYNVITAAANGTLIRSITIKSIAATTEGMVRIFIYDGTNTRLAHEIHIPANTPTATNPAFEYVWNCDIKLKAADIIRATTQTGDDFNIIAEGLDWAYYAGSVRPESTNYTANTGVTLATTANSSMDSPSSNVYTVITAGVTGSGWKGLKIESLTIKAIVTTTMGMIRLFLYDGTNTRLFREFPIPAVTQSGTESTFEFKTSLGNFNLNPGWAIKATTANTESMSIIAEGNDWKYPA